MNEDLNIALVSAEYPPNSLGGVSTVCRDLAANLSKRGISTTVFCGRSRKIAIEQMNPFLRIVRMPVVKYPPMHFWFPLQNHSYLMEMLKEFDVVHAIDTKSAGLLSYYKKRISKPLVTHVHGCVHCETSVFLRSPISSWSLGEFVYSFLEYPMNEFLVGESLRRSDKIVVCSTARLEEMKRRNPEVDYSKVSVIYNGMTFDQSRPEVKGGEDERDSVLFWGRLFYNKGIIQLIKAIALVKKDFPHVILDVCGRGPLEDKIRSLIKEKNLEKNVCLLGYVSNDFLQNKIKATKVVALPSLYEGQPVAALEAMAQKKTLIMFDFPFSREYIRDWHNGLIAMGWNVKDLAERICVALSDKDLRFKLSSNAYDQVRKNHDWYTLIDQYIGLYRNLASRSN
jgi:glycosyltransferase involved in cell wall biosynthesis